MNRFKKKANALIDKFPTMSDKEKQIMKDLINRRDFKSWKDCEHSIHIKVKILCQGEEALDHYSSDYM